MSVKKIGISIPEEVMEAVDRAARERGLSRSRFIAGVLRRAAAARTDLEVTRKIDEVLADEDLKREQADEARALQRAGFDQGTEWV
jgi:hypothetical protein